MKTCKPTKRLGVLTPLMLGISLLVILVIGVACETADSIGANSNVPAQSSNTSSNLIVADNSADDAVSMIDEQAPDFMGIDVVTGDPISLAQYRGSVVLLSLVNYGCNVRQSELVSEQLVMIRGLVEQGMDFQPLSVFCGCCPEDVLRDFALENGLNWPWMLDTEYVVVDQYIDYLLQYGYPTMIFIDQDQTIKGITGFLDETTLSDKISEMSPQNTASDS